MKSLGSVSQFCSLLNMVIIFFRCFRFSMNEFWWFSLKNSFFLKMSTETVAFLGGVVKIVWRMLQWTSLIPLRVGRTSIPPAAGTEVAVALSSALSSALFAPATERGFMQGRARSLRGPHSTPGQCEGPAPSLWLVTNLVGDFSFRTPWWVTGGLHQGEIVALLLPPSNLTVSFFFYGYRSQVHFFMIFLTSLSESEAQPSTGTC